MTNNLITLDTIKRGRKLRQRSSGAGSTGGGCRAHRCGSAAKPDELPAAVWEKVKDHPCYSVEAHQFFARMHVAVAPACNIQCHYCNRKYDCANESRPGVVSEKLTPEQAAHKVLTVAARLPQLSVVGIAGPGDALADYKRTFATCDLVSAKLPDLKLCLSTNGLALLDHVDAIKARNIHHLTITGRRLQQRQRPGQSALRPRQRVPDLRGRPEWRAPSWTSARRPLLPGRLWRGGRSRCDHQRARRRPGGAVREDRPLSARGARPGRH